MKGKMKQKTIHLILWIILSAAFLVLMIMHPRINNGLLLLGGIIVSVVLAVSKKEIKGKVLWMMTIGLIVCFALMWDITRWMDIIYPDRALYEYKKDIRDLKSGYKGPCYTQFPDEIPDNVSRVKWICAPSLWQAAGYEALFFYADEAYLSEVYDTYASKADIYIYEGGARDTDTWVYRDENGGSRGIIFPHVNVMTSEEKANVEVLVLHEEPYGWIGGIYINRVQGYVCFYSNNPRK